MKRINGYLVILGMVLLMVGCGGEDAEEQDENVLTETFESETVDSTNVEAEAEETDDNDENIISTEALLGGKVTILEDTILVKGESNLPEGTVVEAMRFQQPFTLRHIISFNGEQASVNADGTFTLELPLPTNYDQSYIELALEVKMTYSQPDEVISHFGEKGENLEGPFVYPYDLLGETNQKLYIPIYILVGGEETEYPIEAPVLVTPADYGENEVWVEAEVTNDHRYIYVEGKSNLLVGTNVKAAYYSSDEAVLSQHWFSSNGYVEKDGTFLLRIPYDSITDVGFIEFSMWSDYGHRAQKLVTEAYGENFVHLQGEQVIEDEEGKKGIELKLYPEFPEVEFNLPDDSLITMDGNEMKIQLPDNILFDFAESELREDAKIALADFLESLVELEDGTMIQINGHTDNSGGAELNQQLSETRAEAVASYLRENGDLKHLTIEINGFGLTKPIASNEDEAGRQKNRRVEFVINPK